MVRHYLSRRAGETGQDEKEAERAYHALHAQAEDKPTSEGFRLSFRKLADQYLDFTKQTKSEKTYVHQRYFLQTFCDHVKRKPAADLKQLDVTEWLLKMNGKQGAAAKMPRKWAVVKPAASDEKPRWGHNTQVTARGLITACLNWGVEQGYLRQPAASAVGGETEHPSLQLVQLSP